MYCELHPTASAQQVRPGILQCDTCGIYYTADAAPFDNAMFGGAGETSTEGLFAQRLHVIQAVTRTEPDTVLEIGCRSGLFLRLMRIVWPAATFSGVDPSQEAIAFARAQGGMHLEAAFFEDYTFTSAFDLILSTGVFYRHERPLLQLQRMAGGLSPQGRLYLELGLVTDHFEPREDALFQHAHPVRWWMHTDHVKAMIAHVGLQVLEDGWLDAPYTKPSRFWWAYLGAARRHP